MLNKIKSVQQNPQTENNCNSKIYGNSTEFQKLYIIDSFHPKKFNFFSYNFSLYHFNEFSFYSIPN